MVDKSAPKLPSLDHSQLGRLDSIQVLRAVAAWFVVLYHLAETPDERLSFSGAQPNWLHFYRVIGFAGVDLFFVISGVVMMITCYNRFGSVSESPRFLWRRITRVYPLYWIATLVILAVAWAVPSLAIRDKLADSHFWKSFLLWPQDDFPAVAVGWTLVFEMYFYVVFAALLALPRKAVRPALLAWGFLALGLFAYYDRPEWHCLKGNLFLPLPASLLTLEFLAGCGIGWLVCERRCPIPAAALCSGAAMLLLVGFLIGSRFPDESQYGYVRVTVFGSSAALLVYGAVGLELAGRWRKLPGLTFWGDASYALYLSHVYVIGLVAKLQGRVSPELSTWSRFGWTLLCLVSCGFVAALGHLLLEKPLLRLLQRKRSSAKTPLRTGGKDLE
ncbi:acyltransferase family protein [Adhaeretor mobilis]|uniref:Acyltransferase family protein n=1 Tax=Adhaeretor mobilis TaxID=1930276 RepID=A0A517MY17_9BACT|nr:acyltransferase [Adhaeretor mobilis]QDS99769.1 Acyltransferase family protein [Adhaeretor mobilis]